jgi:hypothetical protein
MFLNPSVLDFVASVIASDRQTAEDLINSAVRFRQIERLWRLTADRPNSALDVLLKSDENLLDSALSRLLHGPSTRWETMPDGQIIGRQVDLGDENEIGFLIEVTDVHRSKRLLQVASSLTDALVGSWSDQVMSFSAVLRLLETLGNNSWTLAHGGRAMYPKLLGGLLAGHGFALAEDWLALLVFPPKALEWSAESESSLRAALSEY